MYVAMWAWQLPPSDAFNWSFLCEFLLDLLLQWLHQQWVGDWQWQVACGMWHAAGGTRPQYKLTDKMICLSKNTKNIPKYTENTKKVTAICHGTQTRTQRQMQRLQHTSANRIQLATFNNSPISHRHSKSQLQLEPAEAEPK